MVSGAEAHGREDAARRAAGQAAHHDTGASRGAGQIRDERSCESVRDEREMDLQVGRDVADVRLEPRGAQVAIAHWCAVVPGGSTTNGRAPGAGRRVLGPGRRGDEAELVGEHLVPRGSRGRGQRMPGVLLAQDQVELTAT